MALFYMLYTWLDWMVKKTLLRSSYNLSQIIWNPEDQNNDIKIRTKKLAWFDPIKL